MVDRRIVDRGAPIALVAVGGFAGAALRYLATGAIGGAVSGDLPWGTLTANVLGSFALGVLLYERHFADALSVETRLLVGTGFLSSFTTYSTFAVQTAGLPPLLAGANVVANYALGFTGVVCGRWVARWVS